MTEFGGTPSEELTLSLKGFTFLKLIGEGAHAKVYLCEYSDPKCSLACKVIETAKAPQDFVKKFLPREIDALVRLNHPHLIHIHSIFQRKSKYFIFMRFGENGDLLNYISTNGNVSENQSRVWIYQLGLALEYLHCMEMVHRDIKCENVLLTSNYNVKLCDFGFVRTCTDSDGRLVSSETYCGSTAYAAPEILRGKPYLPKPTDLWSLGVLLFVMLDTSLPFGNNNIKKSYEQQMAMKYRFKSHVANVLSFECIDVVKHLMEPDPGLRYTVAQLLASDWIAMDSRLTDKNVVEEEALKRAKDESRRNSVNPDT